MVSRPEGADRSSSPAEPESRGAVAAAYLFGAVLVFGLGDFLLAIPIQVSDSFGNMLKLSVSWRDTVIGEFTQHAYLRPLLWLQLKAVYELSDGAYYAWFRGTHVLQVAALVALYLHLIRPRQWRDAALVPLGLAVLIGHHAFAGTVKEAFPINTFMTVLLGCFAAAALSLGRYRRWNDPLAVLLFAVAALSVESGLLVIVIFVAGALVGGRGVSRGALVALGLGLVGYFALRFAILDVGGPSLNERASGYGFSLLEPTDLVERFGAHPLPFYVYNVVTSALSVLFGEPRAGLFRLTLGFTLGDPYPALLVTTVACTSATVLMGLFAWRRRAAWRRWALTRDDQLVLLFFAVLAANAVISYPYTKSVIMSPAGGFFALAVFAAARNVLPPAPSSTMVRSVAPLAACAVLSIAWSVRLVGVHVELWVAARDVRTQWAYVHEWIAQQHLDVSAPRSRDLLQALRNDALLTQPAASELKWTVRNWLY
ncbi:MAG: hypothetical protein ABL971_08385 [Vicinamibacterales bacterium]